MHTMDSWSYKDCGLATDVVYVPSHPYLRYTHSLSPARGREPGDAGRCHQQTWLMGSQLKKIVVKPDPPVPGENLTVTVDAEVLREIEVRSRRASLHLVHP